MGHVKVTTEMLPHALAEQLCRLCCWEQIECAEWSLILRLRGDLFFLLPSCKPAVDGLVMQVGPSSLLRWVG